MSRAASAATIDRAASAALPEEVLDRLQDPVPIGDLRGDHPLVAGELLVEVLLELARAVRAAHLAVAEDVGVREDLLLQELDAALGVAPRPVVAVAEVERVDVPRRGRVALL